jgi:hypothetical protein
MRIPQGKALIVSLCLLANTWILSAQSTLEDIDQFVAFVDHDTVTLDQDTVDLSDFITSGGNAISYRDSTRAIRLIRAEFIGEGSKVEQTFYLRGGMVVLCLENSYLYNAPIDFDSVKAKQFGSEPFDSTKNQTLHTRCYFSQGKLFRCRQDNGAIIEGESSEFLLLAKSMATVTGELLSRFSK